MPHSRNGFVEAIADDASSTGFSKQRALPVCAGETLHYSWTLLTAELIAWN
jgi:hypothetical protein